MLAVVLYLVVRHDRDGGCVSTSTAVDPEVVEADEGIGESETDVASNTDVDTVSCPSAINSDLQHVSSATSSTATHEDSPPLCDECSCDTNPASADSMPTDADTTQQTSANSQQNNCLVDSAKSECSPNSDDCEASSSSRTFDDQESSSVIDQGCVADAVELAVSEEAGSYDVSKSALLNDDDPALSEDSGGSSQTLSVPQSLSLNDDDQGSLTDVTETPHSDDSGSSRTVEVGDDDVPQLLDDDVEAAASSLIPDTGELLQNHCFLTTPPL